MSDVHEGKKFIKTKEEFLSFIKELIKDFNDDPESWENIDIESFLEALGAWTDGYQNYYLYHNLEAPENINWNFIANMLYAGIGNKKDVQDFPNCNHVETETDFLTFVAALEKNFRNNGYSWKNSDLVSYLNGMSEWVKNSEDSNKNKKTDWILVADILSGARVYE